MAGRVLRRSLLLLLVGLLLNAVPDFTWHTLRLPGILQRIAVCYACSSLLYLALRKRRLRGRPFIFAFRIKTPCLRRLRSAS